MCVRRAGGRRRRLTVAWQPCDIAVLAQELSQPPSGAAPRRRPLLLDKGRRPLAGIGAARRRLRLVGTAAREAGSGAPQLGASVLVCMEGSEDAWLPAHATQPLDDDLVDADAILPYELPLDGRARVLNGEPAL